MREILGLDFDGASFVANIEKAINVTTELDNKLKDIAADSNKVSFNKPISELQRMKALIDSSGKSLGLNFDGVQKEIDKFIGNAPALKKMLDNLKIELENVSDPKTFKDLNQAIRITETALNKLTGETKKLDDVTDKYTKRLAEVSQQLSEWKRAGLDNTQGFSKLMREQELLTKKLGLETKNLNKTFGETNKTLGDTSLKFEQVYGELQPLSSRLGELEDRLYELSLAGKANTREYENLRQEAIKMRQTIIQVDRTIDAAAEGNQNLKGLALSTQLVVSGFQTYEGVMAAVGIESKDFQETLTKLVALQNVANGVEQISNILKTESAVLTGLMSRAQGFFTISSLQATAAQRAFNTALVASGIGAFVVALGLLVANWDKVKAAITGVNKEQELLNEVNKTAFEQSAEEISRLKILSNAAQSNTKTLAERKKAVKLLKDEYPKYFEGLSEEKILYGDITGAINATTLAIYNKAKAQALQEKLVDLVKEEYNLILRNAELQRKIEQDRAAGFGQKALNVIVAEDAATNKIRQRSNAQAFIENKKNQESILKLIQNTGSLELKEREKTINKVSNANKSGNKNNIENQKKHSLEFNNVVDKEYKDAIEKAVKYYEDLNNISEKAQSDLEDKRISNIQDSLVRENATLDKFRYEQRKALEIAAKENEENLLNFITVNPDKKEEIEKRIKEYSEITKQIQIENDIDYQNKKLEINKKYLDLELQNLNESFGVKNSEFEIQLQSQFLIQANEYSKGLISKEQYEQNIKDIEKKYRKDKNAQRLKEIEDLIYAQEKILNLDPDNKKAETEINRLRAERLSISNEVQKAAGEIAYETKKKSQQIADELAKGNPKPLLQRLLIGDNPEADTLAEFERTYAGIASIIDSSISLIKEQTRAEIEAYDTAIRLQQERVNQAQKIADNGNAEYLQMEEERLKELEQKREAAAQRQLEIDAALQSSQMLVAIAGASAQIAQGGIGNVIAGIATITATVAAGFALLNQLQSSRPRFFEGTETTVGEELGKPHRSGRDGYDISVDGSEMIVNGKITKELRKRGVKASDLPTLVSLGQNRINQVGMTVAKVEAKESFHGIEKRLEKSEKIQKQMLGALKTIKVAANIDREGVASIVSSFEMDKFKSSKA